MSSKHSKKGKRGKREKRGKRGKREKKGKKKQGNNFDITKLSGFLFDAQIDKIWAELNGSTIRIYKIYNNKINNKQNKLKVNIVDLRMFTNKIRKCQTMVPQTPFGMVLNYKNSKKTLIYAFKQQKEQNKWIKIIKQKMESIQYHHHETNNLIFSSWTLIKDNLYWMELTNHGILKINGNQQEINKYSKIEIIDNENNFYRFGLKLISENEENEENEEKTFSFYHNTNNLTMEWFAHFDFVLNNKMENQLNQLHDEQNHHQNANNIYSFKSVFEIYRNYILNETKSASSPSLIDHLSNSLNIRRNKVVQIVFDLYHKELLENQQIDQQNECKLNENECIFFRKKLSSKRKRRELLLENVLNEAHKTLYHKNIFLKTERKNKFIIETKEKNDIDEKEETENKENTNKLCQFAFGEAFSYYHCDETKEKMNYIEAHFNNLKEELLKNPYYKLSSDEYYSYYIKARELQQTKIFKNIKARKYDGTGMDEIAGIYEGDGIRIYHILSLMIYCNEDELQRIFKKHCRKIKINEKRESVYQRHKFIAYWARYLDESCMFYGTDMNDDDVLFCGVDRKMVFKSFSFMNHCPLSTTSDLQIASNFATNNGIIIKIKRNGICPHFNMKLLSNYPREEERFFGGRADLQIIDILIDTKSNKQQILSLNLLQLILSGNLFYFPFNSDLISIKTQKMLFNLLNNQYNEYFIKLKDELIKSFINRNHNNDPFGEKIIHFNMSQLTKLKNEKLMNSILSTLDITKTNMSSKIRFIKKIKEIHFNKGQINKLIEIEYGQKGCMKIGEFIQILDKGYNFHIFIDRRPNENEDYLSVFIHLKTKLNVTVNEQMEILYDFVCPQIKYQKINEYANLNAANQFVDGFKIFSCHQIRNLNDLTLVINIKIVGLLVDHF